MKKIIGIAFLILSPQIVMSTSLEEQSCHLLNSKNARVSCYNQTHKTIPVEKEKLSDSQEVIDSFRCGSRLVQPDMTLNEVSKVCSATYKPKVIEHYLQSFEIHHRNYYGYGYVTIQTYEMEKWTFKQYGRFRTYLVFRDGLVYQIIQDNSIRN